MADWIASCPRRVNLSKRILTQTHKTITAEKSRTGSKFASQTATSPLAMCPTNLTYRPAEASFDFPLWAVVSMVFGELSMPVPLTSIRRALVSSRFGSVTRRTPLLYSAVAPSRETVCGDGDDRVKTHY